MVSTTTQTPTSIDNENSLTYDKSLVEDRKEVERILKKFKTYQKLTREEKKIFQAEALRILIETPEDEEVPVLVGRGFMPIDYSVANLMVTALNLQGEKNKQGEMYPFFLDTHKLQLNLFSKAKNQANYELPYGARGFEIVDMREAFLEWHEFNEFFDCYFLKTPNGSPYRAWFHKDYKGIIRYYTVSPYQEDVFRYSFDAIDLYGMAVGGGKVLDHENYRYLRHKAYTIIRKQQSVIEEMFVYEERERLERIKSQLNTKMRELDSKHSGTMYAVLTELIDEAIERTFQEGYFTEDKRTLFFMSTSELVRRINEEYETDKDVKKSQTTLNNALNLLAAFGFIEKMTDNDLFNHTKDHRLIDDRHTYARNANKNPISYYVINDIPSKYWIEKQAKKMLKKGLTLHNVTEKRFKRAFGRELTEQIFIYEENTRKKDRFVNEKNEYIRMFLLKLRENGYVTKEKMDDIHSIPSQNVANKLWTELTSELRGYKYVRTTKELRETLGIETKGSVFISTSLIHPNAPTNALHKTLDEVIKESLLQEYEELIDEVLAWYGDIFKVHNVPKQQPYFTGSPLSITMEEMRRHEITQNGNKE